jgi:hypothetical protein
LVATIAKFTKPEMAIQGRSPSMEVITRMEPHPTITMLSLYNSEASMEVDTEIESIPSSLT